MSKGTVSGGTDGLYTATILKNDGTPEVKSAYCADLTEDLSGDVGIIEIAGDITNGVNIQPGYEGNAVYNATRDGEMYEVPQKPGTQPSAGVYYNWALWPGWQKWRSKYRYATISDLDGDNCTVTFDACYATDTPDGKQLDCNQVASMSATIEYMSCNGAAFTDGDEVVVELTHTQGVWSSAKVIGFKSEPKGCYWEPWDDSDRPDVCKNHVWTYYKGSLDPDFGSCFSVPAEESPVKISLTDGVLDFVISGASSGGGSQLFWDATNDNGKTPPTIGKMLIKLTSSSSWFSAIRISAGGTIKIYVFAGTPVHPSWEYVGDNGGEEMEIDLTSDFAEGIDITEVRLYNYASFSIGTSEMHIDYISFT